MWKFAEYSVKPTEVDSASSKAVVYIRRNIQAVEKDDGAVVYTCEEQQLDKKDWKVYAEILKQETEISELQDAIIELAGIISI